MLEFVRLLLRYGHIDVMRASNSNRKPTVSIGNRQDTGSSQIIKSRVYPRNRR